MDFHLPSILLLIFPYFVISLLIKQWKNSKSTQNQTKLPPSPPVIGHLHLLTGGLPQDVLFRVAQKYGPAVHLQLGEIFSVVVSSREATKQVMKGNNLACADRAGNIGTKIISYDNNDLIFSPYNAHWRQMRRICVSELLSPINLHSFGYIRRDEMSCLIESLRSSAGEAVNLTEKIYSTMSAFISRTVFGSFVKEHDVLIGLVKKTSTMTTGFMLPDLFPSSKLLNLLCVNKYRLWSMRRRLDAIVEAIVEGIS